MKSNRRVVSPDSDAQAVRRASRIVGLQITIASGVLVLVVLGAALLYIIDQLQPAELHERPAPGESKIYVDTNAALLALVVIGVLAVVIAGILSLVIARRAVRPLGEALRIQRTFVEDASHELRTPLAVLDARLQILQRGLGPDDEAAPAVAQVRRDTSALINIVNDLLLAVDVRDPGATPAPAVLAPSVTAAVESMQTLAVNRDIRIELDIREDVSTLVPPSSVQRCVLALLDNAIAHSPDNSVVTVTVRAVKADVLISVQDHGEGIQGIDPERIFDRFAHADPLDERGRTTRRGFGIGLALVRDLAVRHGGTVAVRESSSNGTTIVLALPRIRSN